MDLQGIVLLVTALGGVEAVKWIVNSIANRKTNARKEDASADAAEIENLFSVIEKLNTQIQRYDERLKQRDDKVDTIYRDWRDSQNEVQQWTQKYHELELKSKEAETRRCDVRGCSNRIPPNDF